HWRSADVADLAQYLPDSVRADLTRPYWLAFRVKNTGSPQHQDYSTTAFVDSILVTSALEICRKPVVDHVEVEDLTDTSVIVRWSTVVNHAVGFTIGWSQYDGVYEDFDGRHSYTYYPIEHPVDRPVDARGYRTELDTLRFVDTIRGLIPNTAYDVAVVAHCIDYRHTNTGIYFNDTIDSRWSDTVRFRTKCGVQPLPYTEDFDRYVSGEGNPISPCWTVGAYPDGQKPSPNSVYYFNTPNSLKFTGDGTRQLYAIMPEFEPSETGYRINFFARSVSSGAKIKLVYVPNIDNPLEYNTFSDGLGEITNLTTSRDLAQYTIDLPLSVYDPSMGRLAWIVTDNKTIYLDNVVVDKLVECPRPSNFVITLDYAHSAKIALINNAMVPTYQYAIGPRETFNINDPSTYTILDKDFGNDELTISNAEITGLSAFTAYTAALRAVCEGDVKSEWSNTANITTLNDDIDIVSFSVKEPSGVIDSRVVGQIGNAVIDHENHTIRVNVRPGTPSTGWIVNFALHDTNARMTIYRLDVYSGISTFDLDGMGANCMVVAEDNSINQPWPLFVNEVPCLQPSEIVFNNVKRRSFDISWVQPYDDRLPHQLIVSDTVVTDFETWADPSNPCYGSPCGNGNVYVELDGDQQSYTIPLAERNFKYHVYIRTNCGDEGLSEWTYANIFTRDLFDCEFDGQGEGQENVTYTHRGDSVNLLGGGENIWYVPVVNDHPYSYSQSLFLTSEMRAGGITQIQIEKEDLNKEWVQNDFSIYMGYTDNERFVEKTNWQLPSTLKRVYHGSYETHPGEQWITFTLDSTFRYDGRRNLIVAMQDNDGTRLDAGFRFKVRNMGVSRYIYYYSDFTPFEVDKPVAATDDGSPSNYRVNTRFIYCDEIDPCPQPDTLMAELGADPTSQISSQWHSVVSDYPNGYDVLISTKPQQSPNTCAAQFLERH
ncbi:MAG: hypothetical protein KBT04_00685, partial [Bacteroidales bacterium]|nr:hypothetical protein [Candidatus Colimorpha onthohippi]